MFNSSRKNRENNQNKTEREICTAVNGLGCNIAGFETLCGATGFNSHLFFSEKSGKY